MSLQGFDILNQKKRKKKTFMDYESGHVGDDNYVITEPRITPKTTTTNKSGKTNTATITKEPKREPFSRSDDDPLKGWNHRLFLEGFYEVDSARTDWEREERMAQVDEALKDIEKRNRKTTPGTSLRTTLPGRIDTSKIQKLPYKPTSPAQVTNLPYYGNRYSGYTKYANASNKNLVPMSNSTARTPTKEELEAIYREVQGGELQQDLRKAMINSTPEEMMSKLINGQALTSSDKTIDFSAPSANTGSNKTQSRDERDANVRNNYRARQQAEADARYENFDIEAAEEKLRDNDYWTDRLLESRRQGYGFAGDERVAEERRALEEEIKRAKEAAERRRERYIREKVAQMPESKPGDMLRWSAGNVPEANQNTFSVSPRFANTLYPETQSGYYNGIPQKSYYTKDKSIYGENTDEALDAISNILTAASLIPGIDTLADAAAIPVDLLRGDYISAGLDAFGVIPVVGEVADTAKLARAGIKVADKAHDAGKVIDAVKIADKADDVADVVKVGDDVYSARKVDGTIKAFLDASDDPIVELTKMSGSIAKTSPVKIPEGATIKPKAANKGYYHMEYKWTTDDGYEYITRWHTRNPTAPLEQRDVWIIERKIKGIGAGPNHRQGLHQVRVGRNEWITYAEWRAATFANQNGFATELQKEWLKNGHWKA